jgi:hypothetical protein
MNSATSDLIATSNGAPPRVLRKCGSVVERVQVSPAGDHYPGCEGAVLVLEAGRSGGAVKTREVGDDPAPP